MRPNRFIVYVLLSCRVCLFDVKIAVVCNIYLMNKQTDCLKMVLEVNYRFKSLSEFGLQEEDLRDDMSFMPAAQLIHTKRLVNQVAHLLA